MIHADDVRDYLLRHPRISAEQIAVKTSGRDDLKAADEAGGLLSRDCPIRFIITKQALQEGWDCSFAYVLTILTNPGSRSALTQLVGRILRQPYAVKTRVAALDESYVFCFQRRGADLLGEVRKGFGLEGLQGLEGRIASDEDGPSAGATLISRQRERYRRAAADLVLPAFMIRDGGQWRLVHHETDILSRVPWNDTELSPLFDIELGAGIYADFILTLKPDEPGVGDEYHRVFVVETKGVHLGRSEDTEYKRSVFDVCSEHARKTNWAEFVPAMRNKVMRFEVVDEEEWEHRLNAMLAE